MIFPSYPFIQLLPLCAAAAFMFCHQKIIKLFTSACQGQLSLHPTVRS